MNNDFGFNSFKKSVFQKFPHLNALGSKFDLDVKLVFWFWRRRFLKGFYHIWAWRPSWSCDQDSLNKLSFPHPKESPYEIWAQLAQWFQRRRSLKMLTDGRQSHWYTNSSPQSLRLRWAKKVIIQFSYLTCI